MQSVIYDFNCIGASWTSPVDSFFIDTSESVLDLRRIKLIQQNIVKLKVNTDNPAIDCIFHLQFEDLYDNNTICME